MTALQRAEFGRAKVRRRRYRRGRVGTPARLCLMGMAAATLLGFSLSGACSDAAPRESANAAHGDAALLLGKIQWAAEHQNYSGRFVHQEGAQIQTSRITHVAEATGDAEKLEMLDGRIREYVRHGDEVQGFIPDRKLIIMEKRIRREKFPALLAAPAQDIDEHYQLERAAAERVAGHLCNVAVLRPRDDLRYGYRLWVDRVSNLLLRVQTLGTDGAVLEQVAFTDISIGGRIDRALLRPSVASTEGWRTEQHVTQPASFEKDGWSIGDEPPGFRTILEIKRTFGSGREVGQMVLSDGLAAVSVFVEASGGPARSEGAASKGAINVLSKALGSYWLTVVGEVPEKTIHQIAGAVALRAASK